MAIVDLFGKPFDDGTLDKLQIFEDYFKEWLPVFIARDNPIWKEIQIFDLFGGRGKDVNGVYGSPLRILSILNANRELIRKNKVKVRVVVNEYRPDNYNELVGNIVSIWDKSLYDVEHYNEDFNVIFDRYYNSMAQTANFLFLDQSGIKQITEDIFAKLIKLKKTDFLFFISSSYIKRFAEVEEFKKYLRITKQDLEGKHYYHIHRIVLNYYRSLITKDYFLAPFSIKKPAGIYGLIFGSNHTYGMEKFLSVCWKHDKITGEANFDIDNEKIDISKPMLFPNMNIPNKRQVFEQNLRSKILSGELKSNVDVYIFTLNEGFLLKDAHIILKELKANNKIDFSFKLITSKMHNELVSSIKLI
ncbi:MAG TPA: three-Cys-motif partner protein TcmP [Chitinophagaceae bacterium]|nr:three-Cys-motif partner protein TcmP [Chitinophagaceae bacterium]